MHAQLDHEIAVESDLEVRFKEVCEGAASYDEKMQAIRSLWQDELALVAARVQRSEEMKERCSSLRQRAETIQEQLQLSAAIVKEKGVASANADIITQELELVRTFCNDMTSPEGPVESIEVASVRKSLALARNEIEAFKSREDALESLLVDSYRSRSSETVPAIEGFTVQPLELNTLHETSDTIIRGLHHLQVENGDLRHLLSESQRAQQDQTQELIRLRAQNEHYKQRYEEANQLLDNFSDDTREAVREAMEQHTMQGLCDQVQQLELDNQKERELVNASKQSEQDLRTRMYYLHASTTRKLARASMVLNRCKNRTPEVHSRAIKDDTDAAHSTVDELRAKIEKQDAELVRMDSLDDELAKAMSDLVALKQSLKKWQDAAEDRLKLINTYEERIVTLQAELKEKDELLLAEKR
jgi:hypothetical protein